MRLIRPDDLPDQAVEASSRLGKLVAAVRKCQGQSQTELCQHANIARNTLSEIERGSPRVQFAHWLAALNSLGLLDEMVSGASAAAGTRMADALTAPRKRRP